jgi:hypothetical protein
MLGFQAVDFFLKIFFVRLGSDNVPGWEFCLSDHPSPSHRSLGIIDLARKSTFDPRAAITCGQNPGSKGLARAGLRPARIFRCGDDGREDLWTTRLDVTVGFAKRIAD